MGKACEIVSALGLEGRVEAIVLRASGSRVLTPDLKDLCQIVYVVLLEYGDEKLSGFLERGSVDRLVGRIVKNNLRSRTSRYYYAIRAFRSRSSDLAAIEYKTAEP